jgi:hypothetical protein
MAKIATRERILDAALEVFARKGYHRALVDDIVRASSTSKGAALARLAGAVAAAVGSRQGALPKVEAALVAARVALRGARDRHPVAPRGGARPRGDDPRPHPHPPALHRRRTEGVD